MQDNKAEHPLKPALSASCRKTTGQKIRAAASSPTTLRGVGGGSDAVRRQVIQIAAGFARTRPGPPAARPTLNGSPGSSSWPGDLAGISLIMTSKPHPNRLPAGTGLISAAISGTQRTETPSLPIFVPPDAARHDQARGARARIEQSSAGRTIGTPTRGPWGCPNVRNDVRILQRREHRGWSLCCGSSSALPGVGLWFIVRSGRRPSLEDVDVRRCAGRFPLSGA